MLRALGLLGGWLVDQAAGDPRRGHPVAGFGVLAGRLERQLYADRRANGMLYTAVLVGVPSLLAAAVERRLARGLRVGLLAALTWAAVGGRSLGAAGRAVGDAITAGDLAAARARLPALCGRDPSGLGAEELCRAAVESVAENTADAVVAPLLWGAVAGPAGVVAQRCANTLDAMVGHRSPRYQRFGWASARLDDGLVWLPARLTAALTAALAPAVRGRPAQAVTVWWRDGGRHPSPNAGRCEAAFAGALGVRLGGANRYGAWVELRGPHGDGPAPGPGDLDRAVRLSRLVGAATVLLAAAGAALTAVSGAGLTAVSGAGLTAVSGAALTAVPDAGLTAVPGARLTAVSSAGPWTRRRGRAGAERGGRA